MTIFLVWLHLLVAVVWVGGMVFLVLTLVPALKETPFAGQRGPLFRAVAYRFRMLVWISIVVLLLTGPLLLGQRAEALQPSSWPLAIQVKLLLVSLLIGLTALHDFWLGPFVGRLMRLSPGARQPAEDLLMRVAPWVARLGLVLALAVLLAAVALVRT